MAHRRVSEIVREREVFRHDSILIAKSIRNDANNLIPPSELRSCRDPSLTALAQLACLRLGASRAMISLFDRQYQHVIAEATPTWSLIPRSECAGSVDDQQLWLCGTSIARSFGICEEVIDPPPTDTLPDVEFRSPPGDLSVTVINDLSRHDRTSDKSYYTSWPYHRFYAGVPIQTSRGIIIGALCVFDSKVRDTFDDASIALMQEMSRAVMSHFELRRSSELHGRGARMVRGLGSFVEEKATISGLERQPHGSIDAESQEGFFNQKQQDIQNRKDEYQAFNETHSGAKESLPRFPLSSETPAQALASPVVMFDAQTDAAATSDNSHQIGLQRIFSRASNVIRESIEVEGVLFVDATIRSFGGRTGNQPPVTKPPPMQRSASPSSSSSEDTAASSTGSIGSSTRSENTPHCEVLGFSTSSASSINGDDPSDAQRLFPENLLQKLLRRYPKGKIYNYDEHGYVQTSDLSSDDVNTPEEKSARQLGVASDEQTARHRSYRPFSRVNEADAIQKLFPGARSVCLVPVWDSHKQRWFSGGFIYTMTPTRIFTVEGELSYLSAFGSVVMADVDLMKASLVSKAASDLMGSLSHELRSPLHGIVLGAELLRDTSLDVFQGDALHSLETCGRTLLDTIDHLLDWTKINNFLTPTHPSQSSSGRGLRLQRRTSVTEGMQSIAYDTEVDVLVEEVVESIYAGHIFQKQSVSKLEEPGDASPGTNLEAPAGFDHLQHANGMVLESRPPHSPGVTSGNVDIVLDIDPVVGWAFHTQPGALRRVIMNLLGNSLKYTSSGWINVSVRQEPTSNSRSRNRMVHIDVVDTGSGISEDYLRHHLFSPFTQEDSYTAGVGLGLSLVRQIVRALRGSIKVRSKLGQGTKVTVMLPLQMAKNSLEDVAVPGPGMSDFDAQVSELAGLRIFLAGFSTDDPFKIEHWQKTGCSEQTLLSKICEKWLKLHVVESHEVQELLPDLILCEERHLPYLLREPRTGSSTPVVVICNNAVEARQLQKSYKSIHRQRFGVFGFISRPIGPRKLAKSILLCFKRWASVQSAPMNTASISTTAHRYDMETSTANNSEPGTPPQPFRSDVEQATDDIPSDQQYEIGSNREIGRQQTRWQSLDENRTPRPATSPLRREVVRSQPANTEAAENTRPRFLLVEDNPVNMKILQAYVKKLGHPYDTAADGKQGLDVYRGRQGAYACILMDISMPVMDGFESTRHIRALEKEGKLERCAIFALTGLASREAQEEAFAVGIDLFLSKPVQLKELTKILKERDVI